MITRIEAYRYRCFEKLAVDLDAYQVLVGRNGAGKSTLMDIPLLIGEIIANRNLDTAFFKVKSPERAPRAEAPLDLIYNHRGDYFAFAIEARIPDGLRDSIQRLRVEQATKKQRTALESNSGRVYDRLRYELAVRVQEDALEISQENLYMVPADASILGPARDGLWGEFVEEGELESLRVIIDRDHTGTARIKGEVRTKEAKEDVISTQVPARTPALSGVLMDIRRFSASQWLRDFLAGQTMLYQPNLRKLRQASLPPGRDWQIAADGSTLAWSILELKKDPEAFDEWLYHVKTVLPLLSDIEAKRREDDGLAYIVAHYGNERKVKNSGLSDGTLSILAFTILPFVKNAPPLTAIEEPENGIHPKAIEAVLEALQAMDRQVLVTTHSPITVAVTPLEKLLCLQQTENEGVIVTRGREHPQLEKWEGIPGLEVLHSAGIL
ncbi:MAG: ATP-binding protein [Opitutales bacterium]|nr:ATP-binding protein [Opitutales bacterium]